MSAYYDSLIIPVLPADSSDQLRKFREFLVKEKESGNRLVKATLYKHAFLNKDSAKIQQVLQDEERLFNSYNKMMKELAQLETTLNLTIREVIRKVNEYTQIKQQIEQHTEDQGWKAKIPFLRKKAKDLELRQNTKIKIIMPLLTQLDNLHKQLSVMVGQIEGSGGLKQLSQNRVDYFKKYKEHNHTQEVEIHALLNTLDEEKTSKINDHIQTEVDLIKNAMQTIPKQFEKANKEVSDAEKEIARLLKELGETKKREKKAISLKNIQKVTCKANVSEYSKKYISEELAKLEKLQTLFTVGVIRQIQELLSKSSKDKKLNKTDFEFLKERIKTLNEYLDAQMQQYESLDNSAKLKHPLYQWYLYLNSIGQLSECGYKLRILEGTIEEDIKKPDLIKFKPEKIPFTTYKNKNTFKRYLDVDIKKAKWFYLNAKQVFEGIQLREAQNEVARLLDQKNGNFILIQQEKLTQAVGLKGTITNLNARIQNLISVYNNNLMAAKIRSAFNQYIERFGNPYFTEVYLVDKNIDIEEAQPLPINIAALFGKVGEQILKTELEKLEFIKTHLFGTEAQGVKWHLNTGDTTNKKRAEIRKQHQTILAVYTGDQNKTQNLNVVISAVNALNTFILNEAELYSKGKAPIQDYEDPDETFIHRFLVKFGRKTYPLKVPIIPRSDVQSPKAEIELEFLKQGTIKDSLGNEHKTIDSEIDKLTKFWNLEKRNNKHIEQVLKSLGRLKFNKEIDINSLIKAQKNSNVVIDSKLALYKKGRTSIKLCKYVEQYKDNPYALVIKTPKKETKKIPQFTYKKPEIYLDNINKLGEKPYAIPDNARTKAFLKTYTNSKYEQIIRIVEDLKELRKENTFEDLKGTDELTILGQISELNNFINEQAMNYNDLSDKEKRSNPEKQLFQNYLLELEKDKLKNYYFYNAKKRKTEEKKKKEAKKYTLVPIPQDNRPVLDWANYTNKFAQKELEKLNFLDQKELQNITKTIKVGKYTLAYALEVWIPTMKKLLELDDLSYERRNQVYQYQTILNQGIRELITRYNARINGDHTHNYNETEMDILQEYFRQNLNPLLLVLAKLEESRIIKNKTIGDEAKKYAGESGKLDYLSKELGDLLKTIKLPPTYTQVTGATTAKEAVEKLRRLLNE